MITVLSISSIVCLSALGATHPTPPVESNGWLLPAQDENPIPYWGVKGGIGVTVPTFLGPRGLIGIQTPYLGQTDYHVINFVAIEPIVDGHRGYSEMEKSALDDVQGLRLWTTDNLERDAKPSDSARPAQGKLETVDGIETLSFYVHIERMKNGAQPIIQVIFRADKPHEVAFKIHAADGSAKMDSCILSATMGNYARLRLLRLKSEQTDSATLWEGEPVPDNGFFPHRTWPLSDLIMEGDDAVVYAQPDESDPASAQYDSNVPSYWKYQGVRATQYWRSPHPSPKLICRVNARETYYRTEAKFSGGLAYENFELEEPFKESQEFRFGAEPIK